MKITLQPVELLLQGRCVSARLVLCDGRLCAVLSWLDPDLDGEAGWFVEAGFGRLAEPSSPVIPDFEGVEAWVVAKLS
ncbi:hypothetical protein [Phenylobacterium sp.]|uniref:hypothetical protein n=1 Tax=Phenylobacterium sp. TaxID=1871053 RepID=UPI002F940B4F